MRCCCVQVSKNTLAPQNYDIHSQIVTVIILSVSILDIRLKMDSHNALIYNSSMALILSGQRIKK